MSDLPVWYEHEKKVFDLDNRGLSDKLITECLTSLAYLRQLDYSEDVDIRPVVQSELDELRLLFEQSAREVGGKK